MRDWLLNSKLFHWAYRQGGIDSFTLVEKDLLETMRDDVAKQADVIAKESMASLLSVLNDADIVSRETRSGALLIGGKPVDESTLANIKAEAEFLVHSELWGLLYETPKKLAYQAMFVDDGTIENQLIKGRAILYMLDSQKRIVDLFL